jgi:hypothetical protein
MTEGNGLAGRRGTCASCEFSHDPKLPGRTDLQCRRLPPVPLVTGMHIKPITGEQTAIISHAVAMVSKDFWCGEHHPRVSDVVPIPVKPWAGKWTKIEPGGAIDIDTGEAIKIEPPKEE